MNKWCFTTPTDMVDEIAQRFIEALRMRLKFASELLNTNDDEGWIFAAVAADGRFRVFSRNEIAGESAMHVLWCEGALDLSVLSRAIEIVLESDLRVKDLERVSDEKA
jgi:hypothetical protein